MVIYKKNGRPTKSEKLALKTINSFLSSISDEDKKDYPFYGEEVESSERLMQIFETVGGDYNKDRFKKISINKKTNDNPKSNNIKQQVSNIIENRNDFSNFVNDEKDMSEQEDILAEVDRGTQGDNEIPSNFSPFNKPIKTREYNKIETQDFGEIREPKFDNKQSVSKEEVEEESEQIAEELYDEEEDSHKEDKNIGNPAMEELSGKEKEFAVEQLVDSALDGYASLHDLAKKFVKYPEEKLQESISKGEIDPDFEFPADMNGNMTNPVEYMQQFNEDAEEVMSYDPEFGEKVKPAMMRVFAKKGWGMTDEQFLLVQFGKDIAVKTAQFIGLKRGQKQMMDMFKKAHADNLAQMKQQRQSYNPDSITQPPRTQKPEPIKEEEYNEEYNDEYSENYDINDIDDVENTISSYEDDIEINDEI